ncbi:ATP-binding cassette domain-containing protein, partial [Candidatus Poribacteria bacterium]|nr:ATP-binding cassette domain-containing protein [Candidatus Poribacteria bacterium]
MSDIVLHVGGLRTYFRTPHGIAKAVDGVSFSIRQGETFAIVGESGCGKSVTALSIMGLVPHPAGFHAGGSVHIGETEMTALSESKKRKLRGREVAMVFQDPMTSLNAVYTVGFQIVEAIRRHGRASEADRLAAEMLDRVGIPDPSACLRSYPHQLSGGMKQRVMIAMALSCRPRLLIADEPTTALDVTVQAQILDLIRDLQRDIGMSVLLITHDLGVVRENSDRIAVMYAGQIVENASTAGLFASPRHPYTEALFRSLPSRQQRGGDLETIEGMVPLATLYPTGCRFADRCDDALPVCRETPPERFSFEAGHDALCHLYAPGAPREDHVGVPAKPMSVRPATAPAVAVQPSGGNALVEVRDLRTHFPIRKGVLRRTVGYVRAVDGVSFSIPRGRTLAVVGESGCGKTTLGKSLLRLAEPTTGEV